MENRAVIVISFDVPPGKNSLEGFQENLTKVKPIFEGDTSVKVYGAVRETAEEIIDILEAGRKAPEEAESNSETEVP